MDNPKDIERIKNENEQFIENEPGLKLIRTARDAVARNETDWVTIMNNVWASLGGTRADPRVNLLLYAATEVARAKERSQRGPKRTYWIGQYDDEFVHLIERDRMKSPAAICRIAAQHGVNQKTVKRALDLKNRPYEQIATPRSGPASAGQSGRWTAPSRRLLRSEPPR